MQHTQNQPQQDQHRQSLSVTTSTVVAMTKKNEEMDTAQNSKNVPSTSSSILHSSDSLFHPQSKYHPRNEGLIRRRRWLVVDFDGTCTEHDTTPLLPKFAAFASRQKSWDCCGKMINDGTESGSIVDEKSNPAPSNLKELWYVQDVEKRVNQFKLLEEEYLRRYNEKKSAMGKTDEYPSILEALHALDEPSTIVTQMVSESRVLEGLGHMDAMEFGKILNLPTTSTGIKLAADAVVDSQESISKSTKANIDNNDICGEFDKVTVQLRSDCQNTLIRVLSNNYDDPHLGDTQCNEVISGEISSCLGWSVAVLSINWCPALIEAAIVQPVLNQRRALLGIETCNVEVPIWSNQVDTDGIISLHIPGALAKRDRIIELRRNIRHSNNIGASVIVYVGDSTTDLAALLEADIGVIIGQSESSSMKSIAEGWEVQVVPLKFRGQYHFSSMVNNHDPSSRKRNLLWEVENWMEIDEMLLEIDELLKP